jgi:uncharacterized protein
MGPQATQFIADALQNRFNRVILERLPALGLPDAWLVAGCLFQSVWNLKSGRPPEAGIKDYDLFYFDAADLSEAAETGVGQRLEACFADLGITVEAKNQARVHTWYEAHFGFPYEPLTSSQNGIDRFLVPCTCVGLQNRADSPGEPDLELDLALYAPYGLDDLYEGILKPNPLCHHAPLFAEKARSYQSRWDWLNIQNMG